MPTYRCAMDCEYCYLGDDVKSSAYKSDAFIRHLNKRLKELSNKYIIDIVEMYGGDLDHFDYGNLCTTINTYRRYCTNDRIMLRDIRKANKLGFKDNQINISLNPERRDYLDNLFILKEHPDVNVIVVVTAKLMSDEPGTMLSLLNNCHGYVTFMPYNNYSPNYPVPYVSNYEYCSYVLQVLDNYVSHKYNFKLTNLIMLEDCARGCYSPAMRNNIFIEPHGKFACVDFDLDGKEYFKTFEKLEHWEQRCKQEDIDRAAACGTCEYFNTCMAEHFKAPNQQPWYVYTNGDICNGYKPLVDWAKARLDGPCN